jgi:molecular chaperone GrpE (heat shock protein)
MTEDERNHDEQHPPIKITDRRLMHRDENDASVGAGEGTSTHDAPTAPDEAGPAGDAGQGGSELEQARREAKEYLDHARRLQAEFDNYRKRVLKEQTRAVQLASEPLVRRLLEVLDDFELALMAAEEMTAEQRPELQRLLKGVELVYAKLVDSLKAEGLERIEAEAFVAANGQLLARLSYASHIPSNGVEEPKSTESHGIGLQVVFRGANGPRLGFGSEPSDLTPGGVRRALVKAREGAVHDPAFVSLPRAGPERRTLGAYHDPRLLDLDDGDLVDAGWRVVTGALRTFTASRRLAELSGSDEDLRRLGLLLGGDVTIVQERAAVVVPVVVIVRRGHRRQDGQDCSPVL